MSMSSVVPGASFTPALELPKLSAAKQQVVNEKFIDSLPGSSSSGPEIARAEAKKADSRRMAADIAQVSQTFNKRLQFVVDQDSSEVIVKVIDKTTDKVIKILPPEELQRLHKKLSETIGFLFNERV